MFPTTLLALLLSALALPAAAAGYSVDGGVIRDEDGRRIQLRGINHFGFNSATLQPQYLWSMGWKQQIAQIRELGFNAVRLPFVPDTLHVATPVDKLSGLNLNLNGELRGKTPLQVLDLWMAEADRQGLFVLLDFHSVTRQGQYPHWFVTDPGDYRLVYDGTAYTPQEWINDLAFVARRYKDLKHFIGIDLYNEPQGKVRWQRGDPNFDAPEYWWKPAAEAAAAAVLEANPRLLVFVEGVGANFDGRENSGIPMNWGENLQPQAYAPLDIPADKLVLAPHTYGPDVYGKASFDAPEFPANLAAHWETLFGQFHGRHAVVIGEWGGHYGKGKSGARDAEWQIALVDYLRRKGMTNSFYWSYTPNSDDTGGILDQDLKVREDKMALLRRLWHGAAENSRFGGGGAPVLTLLGGFAARLYSRGERRPKKNR